MDHFFGVDGTGTGDNAEYASQFKNSHVRRLFLGFGGSKSYWRGPTDAGTQTDNIAAGVVQAAKAVNSGRIFLSGYSRGGAAVIEAAYLLSKEGVSIQGLFLFDAVDRAVGIKNADVIPSNVAFCFHARRHPDAESREFFGNCGTRAADAQATKYTESYFKCTHGGVGGVPWTEANKQGKIQELSGVKLAAARAVAGTNLAAQREVSEIAYTNVTLQQDKDGAVASWTWMQGGVTQAKSG